MSQISTISEFLLQAGTEYRAFDMGRTIRSITSQAFLDMENTTSAPPYPRAGYAWFGLVFWNKQLSNQHYIWFVKLPLDEQGLVMPAARNHFLQIIVDALGAQLEQAEDKQGQLPENPYSFVPNQQQLAEFNSISRMQLGLGHTQYYEAACAYLNAPNEKDWTEVPLQGLTDFTARIQQPAQLDTLQKQFTHLHREVLFSLLVSLENHPLPDSLVAVLLSWVEHNKQDPLVWQHALRALSQTDSGPQIKTLLAQCLSGEHKADTNLLTVIAGRLWHHLTDETLLRLYVDALAEVDQHTRLFAAVYSDLVQIPLIRPHLLAMLRWTDKSPALTQAVGKLFSGQ